METYYENETDIPERVQYFQYFALTYYVRAKY